MKKTTAKMKLRCIMVVWIALVSGAAAICGGDSVSIETIPEQIAILYEGTHLGGGVMIAANWALTVAHNMVHPGKYSIRAGSANHKQGGTLHEVAEIIRHPEYKVVNAAGRPNNKDIALIKVKTPFPTGRLTHRFAKLPYAGQLTEQGIHASVSGWGRLGTNLAKPDILHQVYIPIIWRGNCGHEGLQAGHICAGYHGETAGPCVHDSGGPLTVVDTLIGLVSYGRGPTVFTEVSAFRDWIKEVSGI